MFNKSILLRKTESHSAAGKKIRKPICLLDKSALPDSPLANPSTAWLYSTKIILRNRYNHFKKHIFSRIIYLMFFMSSSFSFRCFIAKQELKILDRMFKFYPIFLSCFMYAKYQFQLSTRSKTKLLGVSPARIIGITGKNR